MTSIVGTVKHSKAQEPSHFPIDEQLCKTPEAALAMAFRARCFDASGSRDADDDGAPAATRYNVSLSSPPSIVETSASPHPPPPSPPSTIAKTMSLSSSSTRESEPDTEDIADSRSRSWGFGITHSLGSSSSSSNEGSMAGLRDGNSSVVPAGFQKLNLSGDFGNTCGCASLYARNCRSCLESVLPNGEACVVTPLGLCMSAAGAESVRPYYKSPHKASNGKYIRHNDKHFSSLDSHYCPSTDEVCAKCSGEWVEEFRGFGDGFPERTKYSCTGRDGCICTAYCELRENPIVTLDDSYNTQREMACSAVTESKPGFSIGPFEFGGYFTVLAYIIAAIIVACGWLLAKCIRAKHDRRRAIEQQEAYRAQLDERRASRMVTLGGWNSYRNCLVDTEHENLGLKDVALSEAPLRVSVQEGEGYRPLSPSHQVPRQRLAVDVE